MDDQKDTIFAAGKAQWLLQNADKLTEDERALLLALVKLEQEEGRELTPEEKLALDKLSAQIAQTDGYAPDEIAEAISKMRTAQTTHPVDEWPSAIYKKIKEKKHK